LAEEGWNIELQRHANKSIINIIQNRMNQKTKELRDSGQSLWLDNITRSLLNEGTLKYYIDELSVTGLTSNPTIFDNAISGNTDYDADIIVRSDSAMSEEEIFFELAIEDIRRAADLFEGVYRATNGVDGFVSIEVSPLLAFDTEKTIEAAKAIFKKVDRRNVFIKIPGTKQGLPAIERVIAEGIPVNVTLLFSLSQYQAASEAWLRGVETRLKAGLNPDVRSVASVFVSRWDKAVADEVHSTLNNKLGIAVMGEVYGGYRRFLESLPVQKLMNNGVSPQRLLWASTGTKDPEASDTLYVSNLVAPFTVNTIPEATLLAYSDHGSFSDLMTDSMEEGEKVIEEIISDGVNVSSLGDRLQSEGADAFVKSWEHLLASIKNKRR